MTPEDLEKLYQELKQQALDEIASKDAKIAELENELAASTLSPSVEEDKPGLYAVIEPMFQRVVDYVQGSSKADIVDRNRHYAYYVLKWVAP